MFSWSRIYRESSLIHYSTPVRTGVTTINLHLTFAFVCIFHIFYVFLFIQLTISFIFLLFWSYFLFVYSQVVDMRLRKINKLFFFWIHKQSQKSHNVHMWWNYLSKIWHLKNVGVIRVRKKSTEKKSENPRNV